MKLTFLGTGTSQGVPVITCDCEVCLSTDSRDKRLRTSAWIEVGGKSFVIDTGPDFRQQALRAGIHDLDAVLFTHQHKDHIAGMDDVRAFNFKYDRPMDVYANLITQEALKREYSYIFDASDYPGVPKVNMHLITDETLLVKGVEVIPIPLLHYKLPVYGFRIGELAYITDANYISPESYKLLEGVKVLVLNALRRHAHISHFTLSEAIEVVEKVRPERAFFTHISHYLGKHAEVQAELPAHITLAYDGLAIEV